MSRLKILIDRLTEFGVNPDVDTADKVKTLKKLLVEIYAEYLNVEVDFDKESYEEEPNFEYNAVRKNVKSNFPDFDWYSIILDQNKMIPDIEVAIGDAIDDLTDIIKDMLVIKWRMENTSEMNAVWHFEFLMRAHSEQHLVALLKYLKNKRSLQF